MRVLVSLLTLAPGAVGGSETYLRGLLSALPPRAVTVLPRPRVPAAGAPRLAGLLAGMAAPAPPGDVIHYPLTVPAPRPGRMPSVVTLHDTAHLDLPSMFGGAERAFRRVAYDGAARRATRVVTPSEHARDRVCALLGVGPGRVVAIPHGIDHARFRPDAREELPVDLPESFVLYPAALWPHKNHDRLLRAMARVPDLHLVLTGTTFGRPAPAGPRVRHLGHVPEAWLPALYRRARALVFPSLYEGFGSPLIEAMACGCPVAASDRGAIPEVCGGAAELFDPEDETAIADAVLRAVAGGRREAGLARAAERTWAASAAAHLRVYAEAAAAG